MRLFNWIKDDESDFDPYSPILLSQRYNDSVERFLSLVKAKNRDTAPY